MLIAKVVRMHYLEYNIRSNYQAYTPNMTDKLEYRIIKSVHIGVKLLYDHGRARGQDAIK